MGLIAAKFGAVIYVSDRMNPDDFGAISDIPSQIMDVLPWKMHIEAPRE